MAEWIKHAAYKKFTSNVMRWVVRECVCVGRTEGAHEHTHVVIYIYSYMLYICMYVIYNNIGSKGIHIYYIQ